MKNNVEGCNFSYYKLLALNFGPLFSHYSLEFKLNPIIEKKVSWWMGVFDRAIFIFFLLLRDTLNKYNFYFSIVQSYSGILYAIRIIKQASFTK